MNLASINGSAYFFKQRVEYGVAQLLNLDQNYYTTSCAVQPSQQVSVHRFIRLISLGSQQFRQPCLDILIFYYAAVATDCDSILLQYYCVRVGGTDISYTAVPPVYQSSLYVGYQYLDTNSDIRDFGSVFCIRMPKYAQVLGLGCTLSYPCYTNYLHAVLTLAYISCIFLFSHLIAIVYIDFANAGIIFLLLYFITIFIYYFPSLKFYKLLYIINGLFTVSLTCRYFIDFYNYYSQFYGYIPISNRFSSPNTYLSPLSFTL